ncbi:MAG: hypothetical protein AAGU14_10645 [Eubacteriaceae bacterium]
MLIEQKRIDNIEWYKDDDYQFKVKYIGDKAILWVNFKGYNIAMPLLIWDFFVEMEDNGIPLKLNKEWNGYEGFEIEKDDVFFFIGLITFYMKEKNADSMILKDKFIDWNDI